MKILTILFAFVVSAFLNSAPFQEYVAPLVKVEFKQNEFLKNNLWDVCTFEDEFGQTDKIHYLERTLFMEISNLEAILNKGTIEDESVSREIKTLLKALKTYKIPLKSQEEELRENAYEQFCKNLKAALSEN